MRPASAVAKPTASLAFSASSVTAGASAKFSYSTAHLPTSSVVYLQQNSSSGWKSIKKLKTGKGSSTITASSTAGRYQYRVRASKGATTVVVSASRYLTVKAKQTYQVSISTLCNDGYGAGGINYMACFSSGQTIVGDNIFDYDISNFTNVYPGTTYAFIKLTHTTCSSLSLTFATQDGHADGTAYLAVYQTGRDAAKASAARNTIGSLNVPLGTGGIVAVSSETYGYPVLVHGTATCTTSTGV